MEKHRIIPKEYMTVSEIAKKMRVTVRTLQYYDKEGFFLHLLKVMEDAGYILTRI
ncbi:MerR family transcriptional regulator [Oceanotoga teriensis]|nr:MerR family DNA-binding transcriptional regulator [Oceanotoga teriensis]MDO7977905.1 MerR family transcriptional regulator [Oceanotoga teriensis]